MSLQSGSDSVDADNYRTRILAVPKKRIKPTILWTRLIDITHDALSKKTMLASVDFILSKEMSFVYGIKGTIQESIKIRTHSKY